MYENFDARAPRIAAELMAVFAPESPGFFGLDKQVVSVLVITTWPRDL